MWTGKDNEGFVVGERLPVRIGFCEVALENAVRAFVLDDEGKMRGAMLTGGFCRVDGAEEDGEGIGAHGLNENCTVGDPVEFGCVHRAPGELRRWGFRIQP